LPPSTPAHFLPELHVAVGVIESADGRILIAQRPSHTHLGGYWEFPGGKLEPGETVRQALQRELKEELDIWAEPGRPLIRVRHCYPERRVLLDVWRVTCFDGTPRGLQGQRLRWVMSEELDRYGFPAANFPIRTAVRLPDCYAILNHEGDRHRFWDELEHLLESGLTLIQFRAKQLDPHQYAALAYAVIRRCHSAGARVIVNGEAETAVLLKADGVHLTAKKLMDLSSRPLPLSLWVGASCHNVKELCQAERIGADFALLSPLLPTATHPEQPAMGWEQFALSVDRVNLPVFALGGLGPADVGQVQWCGGQGVAGIRGFLRERRI